MTDGDRDPDKGEGVDELSEEELESERGGALPDREALSVLNADVAIPADPAIAADVLAGDDQPDDAPPHEPAPEDESAGEAPPADEA
jgi:hypothetical protein